MDRLPAEITDDIIEYLVTPHDKKDIKALALCNKKLNTCARRFLWRSVVASLCIARDLAPETETLPEAPEGISFQCSSSHQHLARLATIASLPYIAKHVRDLTLKDRSTTLVERRLTTADVQTSSVSTRTQAVNALVEKHIPMVGEIMTTILPKLYNLEHCDFELVYRPEWYVKQMVQAARLSLGHLSHGSKDRQLRRWSHHIRNTSDLVTLCAMPGATNMLSHLRELSLTLPGHHGDETDISICHLLSRVQMTNHLSLKFADRHRQQQLTRLFFSSPGLVQEQLSISGFVQDGSPPSVQFYQRMDLGDQSTEHRLRESALQTSTLQILRISHACLSLEWLLFILRRHANSVKTVDLQNTELGSESLQVAPGTWAKVFTFMANHMPALQNVVLRNLGYEDLDWQGRNRRKERCNDPIIIGHDDVLVTKDLSEYGVLETLLEVVDRRAGKFVEADRPFFGPHAQPQITPEH